jgi:hypothetical protein
LVRRKAADFASAAAEHPEFAREPPWFVSQVRLMFTPQEIRPHIARVEREIHVESPATEDDDALLQESPATIAKRAAQFATIKESLTAPELGTS